MTIEQLRSKLGEDVYGQARREAWQAAPDTGSLDHWKARRPTPALDAVCDEIRFDACNGETDLNCVAFFTELYRDIPAYGVLNSFFLNRPYGELSPEARRLFWAFAREMLSAEEPALADPVAYSMWCDLFETEWAAEAWKALTVGAPGRLLERILVMSGPVPFLVKRDLYRQKIGNKRWHYFIYRSLLHSAFDVYGDVDKKEARLILGRLKLSLPKDEQENLKRLRAKLEPSNGR